jgi:hypothetical protein
MSPWIVCYKRGLQKLAKHQPEAALRFFNAAISGCPIKEVSRLARILFCTGAALKRIGLHDCAVQSWTISLRLVKAPPVLRYWKRFSNEYGMANQGFSELDDWRAFYFFHLERYLEMKKSHTLGTLAERDMIRDLIHDAWIKLKDSHILEEKSVRRKISAYKEACILFPSSHGLCASPESGFSPDNPCAVPEAGDRDSLSTGKH